MLTNGRACELLARAQHDESLSEERLPYRVHSTLLGGQGEAYFLASPSRFTAKLMFA
jgi:hypothetical protein